MAEFLPFIFVGAIFLLWPLWSLYTYYQRQKRQAALQALAPQLGLKYHRPTPFTAKTAHIPLHIQHNLPDGDELTYCNVMTGRWHKMALLLFDFKVEKENNQQYDSPLQTAVAFHIGMGKQPAHKFVLRKRTLGDGLKTMLGYQFVPLKELEVSNHVLISFDEAPKGTAAVLTHLPPKLLTRMLYRGVYVSCDGEWLIYHRFRQTVEADARQLKIFLNEGRALVKAALATSAAWKTATTKKTAPMPKVKS